MNGRRLPILAAGLLAALFLPAAAAAQEAGPFEVTVVAGAGFGSRVLTRPDQEVRIGNSGLYGLRFGYAVSRSFRLEAGWSHAEADLLSRDPSVDGSYEESGTVDTNAWELNAFYDFGGASTRGYVGIGAGGMTLSPSVPSLSDSETRFAFNAALGVRHFFGDHFGVRAEGRYRWRDGRTRVGTTVCDGECKPFTTNWYSSAELTGGLSFRF